MQANRKPHSFLKRLTLLAAITVFALFAARAVSAEGSRWFDDPGQLGHYAVGHTNYRFIDTDRGNRPIAVSVFYPVDARDIHSSTPQAEYLTDPYTDLLPPTYWFFTAQPTLSSDWEELGYDRAYERPKVSGDGPFPLVVFSPAWDDNNWEYISIGTRLASHGYVVAELDHWADSQYGWSLMDHIITAMLNRPPDVSFAMTQLLAKNGRRGDLLFRTIDPERIAASGHSLGGYATDALAAGDNLVCDSLLQTLVGADTLPYPANTCVPIHRDRRVKAMISLDGSSWALRYSELARISVPSLFMGETVDQSAIIYPDGSVRDWIARPHAAVNRNDSYRVDVNGANHYSFTNYCDGFQVWFNKGWISSDDLATYESWWPCSSTIPPVATISPTDAHEVVTKYMVAFLDLYFGGPEKNKQLDRWVLTPEYALYHTPTVQFFDSERCRAELPDHTYFTYRAYQLSSECDVAQKDPTGWFAPLPAK